MTGEQEDIASTCEVCGASVYQQHLDAGIARHENGKLMCVHCVKEFDSKNDASGGATEDFSPIQLEVDMPEPAKPSDTTEMSSSRIHALSEATLGHKPGAWDSANFKRPTNPNSPYATRMRTFHCKLSEGAIEFLNSQINEWLDKNEDVVIKFVQSDIGPFEGKHVEQNLIMTLFY